MLSFSPEFQRKLTYVYSAHKNTLLKVSYLLLLYLSFKTARPSKPVSSTELQRSSETTAEDDQETKRKLDRETLKRFLKSAVPSFKSPVIFYFLLQLVLLATRAVLTLKVAALDGLLVSSLIKKQTTRFSKLLVRWMLLGIPASLTNSLLNFTTNQLSLSINRNITDDLLTLYLPTTAEEDRSGKNPNYYTLIHMDTKYSIADPNQRITIDINNLSSSLAALPNHLLKPALDLILCSFELAKSGSAEGTLILGIIAHCTSLLLKFISPNFTKIAVERSRLEGVLRSLHSRVAIFSEEIGFLRGHFRELDILDKSYYELEQFVNYEIKARAMYDAATGFIVKYTWGAAGLVLCSAPIFLNKLSNIAYTNSSATFITNRRLLISASSSLGMLITSRKEIQQVVGYMSRLSEFKRALINIDDVSTNDDSMNGVIKHDDNTIEFKDIPLITPANIVLVNSLSFKVNHGDNLLIVGPNGCGKSSLFRILGGLWPVASGELTIPNLQDIFYLPQRAYLSKSSLRDQIIYPETKYKYKTNKELIEIMKVLDLSFLLRENIAIELSKNTSLEVRDVDPFDTVRNWPEELSTGVQQRLAMSRLYYHKPKFAVLDECTSAVSPQMEQLMYAHAQALGISLLSVAHRSSLWHFHNYILKFRGDGTYSFSKLDAKQRLEWESELMELNKLLRDVPLLEAKLKELKIAQESQEIRRTQSQLGIRSLPQTGA